ncbi:HIT domain-containing protein [Deinococcus sp.]|uniref:HIT family protein n=1 Tax=Deinococcus sp. TaxID=47478 RepID=UPI0025F6CE0F|nr:HIT domain-containing protein [Deinococcus sp.]
MLSLQVVLDDTLLHQRQQEWAHWAADPETNPLRHERLLEHEFTLQNDHCVYSLDSRFSDGLPHSGIIVTRRPCATVFDLTPAEASATHALLAEVRAHLDATVSPDGYTIGWNVFPAGGQHVPHVHLHVIPRWNADTAAGVGLRWFLKHVARSQEAAP